MILAYDDIISIFRINVLVQQIKQLNPTTKILLKLILINHALLHKEIRKIFIYFIQITFMTLK